MPESDAFSREIISNALSTAGNEMALAMYRTAYSTVVRDCLDYATSLCNTNGVMIGQGTTLPLQLGAVPFAMEKLFEKYANEILEGDVFILNDPFEGGMHTPDIFIVKPIFWEHKRVAFAVCTAHHLDVGGRVPGTGACDNTDIFQEGLRIPWLKLYQQGKPDRTLFELFRTNVRVPEMTVGDLMAQVAACNIGERAIHDLIRRYGLETFVDVCDDLIDYTERLMRTEIASWPDGSHAFTDYIDSDGVDGAPVRIQVTATVQGDSLTIDFTGTSPQVRGALNATESFVTSAVTFCVRALMKEDIPNTGGMFRPIRIIAPKGTVVNVQPYGACSMRGVTGFRMVDAIFGALAGLLPDRVFAAGEGGNSLIIIGGQWENRPYVFYELFSGTWGARPDRDGNDGLCNPANVASNISIERAECEYPIMIERYGFVTDTGGVGRFRGGLSIEREWRYMAEDDADLIIRSDRQAHRPYGLAGGQDGSPSVNTLYHKDHEEALPVMVTTRIKKDERIYHQLAGGGGYGDPLKRNPDAVVRDIKNGKVSLAAARERYGVVVDETTLEVDDETTAQLRRK